MRPIIKKLGHLGIAAVFGLVVVIGLSTCGGKQKRQPGSLPEEAAAPATGAAAKGEATKGEEVMGTNPTVAYGDDRGVAGQENFSIFQLAGAGPWASYDSSAARINNVDVAAASLMASPREVVEKASECKSPGRMAASGSVIAVCVGETKVLWAGSDDFVIKADSEMPIAVLSKPEFIKSFVGSRDDSEKFSGSMSTEKGNTLVLLGYESFKRVSQPGGGGSGGVVPPPAADPGMGQIVNNIGSGSTTPPGGSTQPIPPPTSPPSSGGGGDPNGPVTCQAIECQGQGGPSTPNQPGMAISSGLLTANTVGIYFSDFSIVNELGQLDKGAGIASRRMMYAHFPAGSDVVASFFGKLGVLTAGQAFNFTSADDKHPLSCGEFPAASVFGIKIYHLFLEIPAKNHCSPLNNGIKISFPALSLRETVSKRTLKDHGVSFLNEVPGFAQTNGKVTMGLEGWRKLSNHKEKSEYDRLDTSLELLIAPALESMEGVASQIYAAHLFIGFDQHNSSSPTTDMKGRAYKLTSSNVTMGVFPLGGVAPFHTLVIRPHLLHLDMKHQKVEYAWPIGTEGERTGQFEVPLFLDTQNDSPVAELNQMRDHARSCGFDVLFSPVGNEAFQVILAVVLHSHKDDEAKKRLTVESKWPWPVQSLFYIETLFDLQAVTYATNDNACIAESAVEMTTGTDRIEGVKELTQEFNIISGPRLTLAVTANIKVAAPSPTPAASP